jgi:hypothetical protein
VTGRSLVQRSPTECGVSECNREASTTRRPSIHEEKIISADAIGLIF